MSAAPDRTLVAEALTGLPEAHRAVLSRAYYLGWTTRQIAQSLGITESTVKAQLHHALRRLALTLAETKCTPPARCSGFADFQGESSP